MKIRLVVTGKTELAYIREGRDDYASRIRKYIPFEITEIAGLKSTSGRPPGEWKKRESELIMKHISPGDYMVLLDEHGKELGSREFSGFLNQRFAQGLKTLVFLIGGPYGFDEALIRRADFRLSLSRMTFPHQLVRLIFLEQLYRAMTILKNEPYHHD